MADLDWFDARTLTKLSNEAFGKVEQINPGFRVFCFPRPWKQSGLPLRLKIAWTLRNIADRIDNSMSYSYHYSRMWPIVNGAEIQEAMCHGHQHAMKYIKDLMMERI